MVSPGNLKTSNTVCNKLEVQIHCKGVHMGFLQMLYLPTPLKCSESQDHLALFKETFPLFMAPTHVVSWNILHHFSQLALLG